VGPLIAFLLSVVPGAAGRASVRQDGAAAAQLDAGLERAQALASELRAALGDAAALPPLLQQGWQEFVTAIEACRGPSALVLGHALYEVAPAPWSVQCLEGALRRTGDYEGADRVLVAEIERTTDPAERRTLVERRALVAAGAGWSERERDVLGQALALGGTDAYQILGRLSLAAGELDRARILFRVLVERHPPPDTAHAPPWALRGWGLTLLPPP